MTTNYTYALYGASDDLAELDGDARDEWDAIGGTTIIVTAAHTQGSIEVVFHYGGEGTWAVYPTLINEDQPGPAATFTTYTPGTYNARPDRKDFVGGLKAPAYSMVLEITSTEPLTFEQVQA